MISMIEFEGFPKTPRLYKTEATTITEKIDGTNACVVIQTREYDEASDDEPTRWVATDNDYYAVGAQSRKRLITPDDDNAGFARWVWDNATELVDLLGPGRHFGEWWGRGIQRGYGMDRKVFSLFHVNRWAKSDGLRWGWFDRARSINMTLVPTMWVGRFSDYQIDRALDLLRTQGSLAASEWGFPGQKAEGVVVRHKELGRNVKVMVENDDISKGEL